MNKKIALVAAGILLLASPFIVSAQSGQLTDTCANNMTVQCLQQEVAQLIQVLNQLLSHRQPPPTNSGSVVISSMPQPGNTIAPQGAVVPFTNFSLTNTSSSTVPINNRVVQQTGTASPSAFEAVALQEASTTIATNSATANAADQWTLGTAITLAPRQSL